MVFWCCAVYFCDSVFCGKLGYILIKACKCIQFKQCKREKWFDTRSPCPAKYIGHECREIRSLTHSILNILFQAIIWYLPCAISLWGYGGTRWAPQALHIYEGMGIVGWLVLGVEIRPLDLNSVIRRETGTNIIELRQIGHGVAQSCKAASSF